MSRSPKPRSPNVSTSAKGAQTAFKHGAEAARAGKSIDACPYAKTPNLPHQLNPGSRWRAHWMRGFESVKKVEVKHTEPEVP